MKIVLDECLPRRLVREFPGFSVTTVQREGWGGLSNGELLSKVEPEFDVFITMDTNIVYQQDLSGLAFCLIVLHAPNSRYESLHPLVQEIRSALAKAKPGEVFDIGD